MFTADLDQDVVTLETQAAKRTAAEVTIDKCEDLVRTMKTAIEAKVATETEAAA